MALSKDPEARARQLANLVPGAGQWDAGATVALVHGARTRRPSAALTDPIREEIVADFEAIVPMRDENGDVLPAFAPMIANATDAALMRRRLSEWMNETGGIDPKTGEMRTDLYDALGRAIEREARALERLALTVDTYVKARSEFAQGTKTMAELIADASDGKGGAS